MPDEAMLRDLIERGEDSLRYVLQLVQEERQEGAAALAGPDARLSALDIAKIRSAKVKLDRIENYILHALSTLPETPAAQIAALKSHTAYVLTLMAPQSMGSSLVAVHKWAAARETRAGQSRESAQVSHKSRH
jgi:hypothetical protein